MSGASNFVKIFYFMCHTVKKHCRNQGLQRLLVPPIGITHKKFEGNISKIDSFIEIFVMPENNVPLIFPPFLPFK